MCDLEDIQAVTETGLARVKTTIQLDWQELGRYFMQSSSIEQAAFLRGWTWEAGSGSGTGLQYASVSQEMTDSEAHLVAANLRHLADMVGGEES